jgi:hypothetical protein
MRLSLHSLPQHFISGLGSSFRPIVGTVSCFTTIPIVTILHLPTQINSNLHVQPCNLFYSYAANAFLFGWHPCISCRNDNPMTTHQIIHRNPIKNCRHFGGISRHLSKCELNFTLWIPLLTSKEKCNDLACA